MAPTPCGDVCKWLKSSIASSKILVFSKTTCPFCNKLKAKFNEDKIRFASVELNKRDNGAEIQAELLKITGCKTVPQVFVGGEYLGGADTVLKMHENNELEPKLNHRQYDYDLVVVGGGSGGLAASKEASKLGAKVAVLDFVEPTPQGTRWGLGGTCVNVGCIPKKLMHTAAIMKHNLEDAEHYGWNVPESKNHSFNKMVENIQSYIHSLNWGYRVALRTASVTYINAKGELKDEHNILTRDASGQETNITAETIILATGERPRYPNIPGDKECGITSDDIFSLPYHPGKTLVIGASYVALECAGFLTAIGVDTTVMVRSILLRGFDQQMADMAGDYMLKHNTKFVRSCVPKEVKCLEKKDVEAGKSGLYEVTGVYSDGREFKDTFNTVLFAIGRDPCTRTINLEGVGISVDKVGRVICNEFEQTSVPNIYAIGDIVSEKLQLTPVAIQAGINLARRLYGASTQVTDYTNVPTTVFTPLEYGAIGLSEESALAKYGASNIEIYHSYFKPLEWTVAGREDNTCYAKLLVNTADNDRIVGFHILTPNAGEITQGFAIGFKLGATKADIDDVIGIHPTIAEVFTDLKVSKSSGASAQKTGC